MAAMMEVHRPHGRCRRWRGSRPAAWCGLVEEVVFAFLDVVLALLLDVEVMVLALRSRSRSSSSRRDLGLQSLQV
jgi:hypothetical protein